MVRWNIPQIKYVFLQAQFMEGKAGHYLLHLNQNWFSCPYISESEICIGFLGRQVFHGSFLN